MRLRMLTSLAGNPGHSYGDIVDVEDRIGRVWIGEQMAESAPATERERQQFIETTEAGEPTISEQAVTRGRGRGRGRGTA